MTAAEDSQQALQATIAALQAQRALLGDAVVDVAVAGLHTKLAALQASAPAEPAQSLKQVSILFLDVVGSTTLSQHLDPEETSAVMDGVLRRGTVIVEAHRGRVLQYAGDSILAVFGAEEAAEDDTERAVHCGLALLGLGRALGAEVLAAHGHADVDVRVGLHTGGVLLGGGGGGAGDESAIRGLAVNIAARMEQTAPPGALRISHDSYLLVRGMFDVSAPEPLAVKGVDEPVVSYRVFKAKARAFRLPARGIAGQETPLIGRRAELDRLDALLESLLHDRAPRTLTLIAEAGLGKSRLLHEFQHRLSAHRATWWLMPARAQPSSVLQPYGLLRDLLVRRLEIADSDSADVARGKFVAGLAPWLAEPNDPAPELLGQLIGLDFSAAPAVQRLGADARLLRDRALVALGLWLARLAASDGSPVVLLLDDLHWADDASLDALVPLLKAASVPTQMPTPTPLLGLLCARPGLIERRPDWGAGLPRHEHMTLEPLSAAQGAELTQAMLRRLGTVPAVLTDLIEQRAEGNPYFAEELVGMLLDQGVIETRDADWVFHEERLVQGRLPTTLTGVLQARIDALGADARRALQMASVIGPVFWDEALRALDSRGPAALPMLRRKALVQQRPTSAFEDTVEESFHHHLLHQVSYDTVLKAPRRDAHARAAAWLTERVGERSDEYLAITAEHHERAGQHDLAADWFFRASIKANSRCAFKAVLQYLDRAEAQAALAPTPWPMERVVRAIKRRANACDALALRDAQAKALDRLLALGEAQEQPKWVAEALSGQSLLAYRLGNVEQAELAGRRGAQVAEDTKSAINAVLCRGNLAWMAIERRDFDTARRELESAERWATLARERMESSEDGIYEVQIQLVWAQLHEFANDDSARGAAVARALELMRGLQSPRLQCSCHTFMALGALTRAELPEAAAQIEAAGRLAAEFGMPLQAAMVRADAAQMHLQAGLWAAAAREAVAAAAGLRAIGDVRNAWRNRSIEAEALWRDGLVNEAVAVWQPTAAAWAELGEEVLARGVRLRLADAQSASGRPEEVEAARQAVLAEWPALQGRGALDMASYAIAARLAAWRVLQRAQDPAAAVQLELAAAELAHKLSGFSDPAVRERVAQTVPWHRDVLDALGTTAAAFVARMASAPT